MNDKDNKLIALFMGLKPHHQDAGYLIDESKDEGYEAIHESCFLYDSSWDWLIPVAHKLEGDGLDPHELINEALWRSPLKIEDLYNEVVHLINIYNDER